MTKAELRKTYLQKRKELPDQEYFQANQRLCDFFFTFFDLSFVKVLHTFLPITANKEPDTWLIIDRVKREFPSIKFSIPRINKATDLLENFYFEGFHQLEENSWGIKQPKQGDLCTSSAIDMVLVPLLTFDQSGHRVGYGKGYYDRFLATCKPECKKIGLSLFPPIAKIPSAETDIPLDFCVTPQKIYEF